MSNKVHRRFRFLRCQVIILFIAFIFLSCSHEPFYILTDPYSSPDFTEKASFNFFTLKESIKTGSTVTGKELTNRDEIAFFISQYQKRGFSKRPVVSPLIYLEGREIFNQAKIKPIIYNFHSNNITNGSASVIQSDRKEAFKRAGIFSAEQIDENEHLFLFISIETPQRIEEYNSFMEGFLSRRTKESLIEVKIESQFMRRPGDIDNYQTLIRDRKIGLYAFFSGSFNFELADRFIMEKNYFITEDYKNSSYKKENCIGSVEDDIPKLISTGLLLSSKEPADQVLFCPAVFKRR